MGKAVAALPGVWADERLVGAAYVLFGWTLVYLVMFDQGTLLGLLAGGDAHGGPFHELFHDGRHFGFIPCH